MRLLLSAALALSITWPAHAQLAAPNAAGVSYGHVHLNVKDVELKLAAVSRLGRDADNRVIGASANHPLLVLRDERKAGRQRARFACRSSQARQLLRG